jgi:hypothetical protein
LSYNNILVDPVTGTANIIDCDGLVVPGKYPPDVVGTPDFIAPEVLETRGLKRDDPNKTEGINPTKPKRINLVSETILFFVKASLGKRSSVPILFNWYVKEPAC